MAADKEKLVNFLEKHAFDPVMRAKPEDVPDSKRDKLEAVQRSTRGEIERFRNYASAEDVVTNFRRDLNSDEAEEVHGELKDLGLPTLHDVKDDFEKLASDLEVGR